MAAKHAKIAQPLGAISILACLSIAAVRGGNPVAIKIVLQSLSPMQGAFARVAISCASTGAFALARNERLMPKASEIAPLALLSVIYAVQISATQTGSDYTSPVFVAILFNTYPVIANLVSSFVVPEDRLSPGRGLGLAAAFAGVAWAVSTRTESSLAPDPLLGNALTLLAATLLAFRMVYLRQVVLRVDYVRAVFWPLLWSLPLFALGGAAIPESLPRASPDWTVWSALVFQGIVVGGAGQLAWIYLIRKHTPGTVIAFSFLTPVSGLTLAAAYFGEPVPPRLLVGLSAVLVGIAMASRRARPAEPPDAAA